MTVERERLLEKLFRLMVKHQASDLHLQVDAPPMIRINGIMRATESEVLTPDDTAEIVRQIAPEHRRRELEESGSTDFSYSLPGEAHFRVNAFRQQGTLAIVFRLIGLAIPSFEELNLPPVLREIAETERGLILLTGTTGSGKSTTIAAMLDHINATKPARIITIEDPIEYVHESKKSMVAQIEIGSDTGSFDEALRRVLRQDPDVILVGEMRDIETMKVAIRAADTGHLVFSTVHATNASQTIKRIIAMFPEDERDLLLTQLSGNLVAVISQRLARTVSGDGRVPVLEIMRNTPIVEKLLLEARLADIPQAIANREMGMQLFDQHLAQLYQEKKITGTEALRHASNPEAVSLMMRGITTLDATSAIISR